MIALLTAVLVAAAPGSLWTPAAPVDPDPPARSTISPEQHPERFFFSAVETGLLIGGGALWYWARVPSGSTWDLHFDLKSWKRKADGGAIRFDGDWFDTNAVGHPMAGIGFFQVARGNGMSFAHAYLWAFVSSLIWEYLVEFKENPSLNDIIITPAAGAAAGESIFRLGRFFDAGAPTLVNRAGAILLSPFAVLDDLAHRRRRSSDGPYDLFGFDQSMGHRFVLSLDQLICVVDGVRSDQTSLAIDTALISYRGYRAPGSGWAAVGPGQWSELSARLLMAGSEGIRGVTFHSGTLLVGRYFRNYGGGESEITPELQVPNGWGALLGLSSAFDYMLRDLGWGTDRLASAGLIGPSAELRTERRGFGAVASLSVHYSFALVESLAYLADGGPPKTVEINTTLRSEGYYYGHGVTSRGALAMRLGAIELCATATFAAIWSLNGRDHSQGKLDADLSAYDTRSTRAVSAGARPFGGPVVVNARIEHIQRRGSLAGTLASSAETRAGLGAGLVF